MKRRYLLAILVAVITNKCFGQLAQSETNSSSGVLSVNSQTGNSKSLYSPDLFTGILNVNIPIYQYKICGLDLGISLSYATGGIKLDEVASDIGLGWGLNNGGSLSRKVNGIEDEMTYDRIDTESTSINRNIAIPKMYGSLVDASGNRDKEPDLFTANIGGQSVSFFLSGWSISTESYHLIVGDRKNIYVDVFFDSLHLYSQPSGLFSVYKKVPVDYGKMSHHRVMKIRITDQHGNQFYFDKGIVHIKRYSYKTFWPTTNYGEVDYYAQVSWNLTKVITYTGAEIRYEFTDGYIQYPSARDQRVAEQQEFSAYHVFGGVGTVHTHPGGLSIINDEITTTQYVSRISKVFYPNGDVVKFNYDVTPRLDINSPSSYTPGNFALSNISVSKGYESSVENKFTYKFVHSYFNGDLTYGGSTDESYPSNTCPDPVHNLRLRLNKIIKIGNNSSLAEDLYSFDYYTSLPPRLSGYNDCYGYFNGFGSGTATITPGFTGSASLCAQLALLNIPLHSGSFVHQGVTREFTYGRDKSPNWALAKRSLLYKITNGLGGSYEFIYQNHTLSNPPDISSTPSHTGYYDGGPFSIDPKLEYPNANDGVCIYQVIKKDGYNIDNTTKTTFNFAGGMRFFVGGYSWSPNIYGYPDVLFKTTWANNFVSPQEFYRGANHGYSVADVVVNGYMDREISHTKYFYTNLIGASDENRNGVSLSGQCRLRMKYGDKTHTLPYVFFNKNYMGLLKSELSFNPVGGITAQTSYVYNEYKEDWAWDIMSRFSYDFVPSPSSGMATNEVTSTNTIFEKSKILLTKTINRTYSGTSYIESIVDNTYDDDLDLKSTATTNSKGETSILVRNYQKLNYTYTYDDYADGRTRKFLIAKKNVSNGNIVGFNGIDWTFGSSGLLFNVVKGYGNSFPVPNSSTFNTIVISKNTLYDDHNNPIETSYNNDASYSVSFWDTRIGEQVAKITNAKYNEVAYSSFEGRFLAGSVIDYNKGNWLFNNSNVTLISGSDKTMTGRYYYNLTGGNIESRIVPQSGKKYFFSLWFRGEIPTVGFPSLLFSLTIQQTVGEWKLATGYIVGNGVDPITVSNSGTSSGTSSVGCNIDELRLIPADASIVSFTYEPLIGVISICNERGQITYQEYDAMGRSTFTRDIHGNIVKFNKTVIGGNDN